MNRLLVIVGVFLACKGGAKEDQRGAGSSAPTPSSARPAVASVADAREIDAPAAPAPDAPPPDKKSEIRDVLNQVFRQQDLPAVALVDGSALVLMTFECDKKILSGFRDLLAAMKQDPSTAFDTFECSSGFVLRFRGKDTPEANKNRAKRTIRTEAARALSKLLVANQFPFDVALSGDDETLTVLKACNPAVLDEMVSDEVGESIRRGGFTRVACSDGTTRALTK